MTPMEQMSVLKEQIKATAFGLASGTISLSQKEAQTLLRYIEYLEFGGKERAK